MNTKYTEKKALVGAFVTHDSVSPILDGNAYYIDSIFWLNAVLPINSFMTDGMPSADAFVYFWGNKKAHKTYTDNPNYFVHRGKMDIFNFSRRPGGPNSGLKNDFITSNNVKFNIRKIYSAQDFKFEELRTTSSDVFAYTISGGNYKMIVYGNVKKDSVSEVKISVPGISTASFPIPIKINSIPKVEQGKLIANLLPYEIQILIINTKK
jgi:hypothetical protein